MRLSPLLLACAALGLGSAALGPGSGAAAQTIRGTVNDQATGKPVVAAKVTLLAAAGRKQDETTTDSLGHFEVEPDLAGSFRLRLEALGYVTREAGPVAAAYGELVEVTLELAVQAIPLPALTVTARSFPPNKYLENQGFYERRKTGQGIYMTREEIMKRRPTTFSDLMRTTPGMQVQSDAMGGRRASSTTIRSNGRCQPVLILDGTPTTIGGIDPRRRQDTPLDDVLEPRDIEGFELYRGSATIPTEYNINASSCGVLLVWTRRK